MPVHNLTRPDRHTYWTSNVFTPAATPTDLVTITGSATRTVHVHSFRIGATNTAAGSQQYFLIKRSTADTGGTFVASTMVPVDAQNPAATAVVGHYTVNPAALGTVVGTPGRFRRASPVAVPATFAGIVEEVTFDILAPYQYLTAVQPFTLRGVAQQLVINFAGAALVAGQTHIYTVMLTEE